MVRSGISFTLGSHFERFALQRAKFEPGLSVGHRLHGLRENGSRQFVDDMKRRGTATETHERYRYNFPPMEDHGRPYQALRGGLRFLQLLVGDRQKRFRNGQLSAHRYLDTSL
jgi:hypothetical protein